MMISLLWMDYAQRGEFAVAVGSKRIEVALLLIDEQFNDIVASIGLRTPDTPGSTASILAALLGLAMGKMAIAVSDYDGNQLLDALLRLDDISERACGLGRARSAPVSAAIVSFV